jgi:hypothetical protein
VLRSALFEVNEQAYTLNGYSCQVVLCTQK